MLVGDSVTDWGRDRHDPADLGHGHARLVADALAGTRPVLVEPFVVPVTEDQQRWHENLDPEVDAVGALAERFSAVSDSAATKVARRAGDVGQAALAEDGVHPTPLGHRVPAGLWLDVVGVAA